jgi:hypothetical protein
MDVLMEFRCYMQDVLIAKHSDTGIWDVQ